MSESRETGVVDMNLKVHGYPDIYITDGSVIQGNIGVNPARTGNKGCTMERFSQTAV
jgi:cholesterol oxidase